MAGQGHDDKFFPVRNESDFYGLRKWLAERDFSDVVAPDGLTDSKGKPLVALRLKCQGKDGKPNYKKRGLIWFPGVELRDKALPIIAEFAK